MKCVVCECPCIRGVSEDHKKINQVVSAILCFGSVVVCELGKQSPCAVVREQTYFLSVMERTKLREYDHHIGSHEHSTLAKILSKQFEQADCLSG